MRCHKIQWRLTQDRDLVIEVSSIEDVQFHINGPLLNDSNQKTRIVYDMIGVCITIDTNMLRCVPQNVNQTRNTPPVWVGAAPEQFLPRYSHLCNV